MSLYIKEQIISRKELMFKHRYMFGFLQTSHRQAVQEVKVQYTVFFQFQFLDFNL
jgi:hypothetical protein